VGDNSEQHAVVNVQPDHTSRHELERQVNGNSRLRYIDNPSRRRKVGVFYFGHPDLKVSGMTFMNTAIHGSSDRQTHGVTLRGFAVEVGVSGIFMDDPDTKALATSTSFVFHGHLHAGFGEGAGPRQLPAVTRKWLALTC
jgi:hypothetical protein